MKLISGMTYPQTYWINKKAKDLGITANEYMKSPAFKDPRLKKEKKSIMTESKKKVEIDLSNIKKLDDLFVNDNMLKVHKTKLPIDVLFSYEEGIPVGTNIMCTGDPGVGKTTITLHALANLQKHNKQLRCLFVSAEMSKIQLFKYTKRFPIFGVIDTLFTSDYLDNNLKDVLEKAFESGYDYILIDSIVEVFDSLKEDNKWSQSRAEKWLIEQCVKNNTAKNKRECYSTFLLIQQVTKAGVFVGSNKMKHITDAHLEMKREKESGETYLYFTKNRNGQAGIRFTFQLNTNEIHYGNPTTESFNNEEGGQFELSIN